MPSDSNTALRPLSTREIDLGAETVVQMALYFAELKQGVAQFAADADVGQRGFFLADEDHRARALLVSYWHARNALFELVTDFRHRVAGLNQARDAEFIVPFAAALLLIDAARFLRNLAEERPVVRRKFNEPDATFGIPGGTYDIVQKSLVSSRHAWHIYHALRYFDQHQSRFAQSLNSEPLRQTFELAATLSQELQISLTQFTLVKLRTRSDQWLRHVGRSTVVRALYGLQKLAGEMMSQISVRPGHQPRLPESVADQMLACLQTGDVCLVRKEYALTNYFLPGFWPHVALYLGSLDDLAKLGCSPNPTQLPRWHRLANDNGNRVLESMKDGVLFRPLSSPFAADSIVILRPQLGLDQIAQAVRNAYRHEGKPYDFDFDFRRSDRLVCTEVVYRSYEGVGPIRFELIQRAGRPTLSGHDLIQMSLQGCHFTVAAAYAPHVSSQAACDPRQAQELVAATLSNSGSA